MTGNKLLCDLRVKHIKVITYACEKTFLQDFLVILKLMLQNFMCMLMYE